MEMLKKSFRFDAPLETKEEVINGMRIGIVEGYASTFGNLDRDFDVVVAGAFDRTLKEHRDRDERQVRIYYNHSPMDVIGGAPLEFIKADDKGLFIRAMINLEVKRGQDAYALAKQGVLCDFSIGYSVKGWHRGEGPTDGNVTYLTDLTLWEVSLVNEPANMEARVTAVKSFKGLNIADRATTATPTSNFLWKEFMPLAAEVDGKTMLIPSALYTSAAILIGMKGGVDIPEGERGAVIAELNEAFKAIGEESPFERKFGFAEKAYVDMLENIADVECLLKNSGYTNATRTILISKIKSFVKPREETPEAKKSPSDSSGLKEALQSLQQTLNPQSNGDHNVGSQRI